MSNDSPYADLDLDSWLKDGNRFTPTLPHLARWIADQQPHAKVLDTGTGSGELLRVLSQECGFHHAQLHACDCEFDHVTLAHRRSGLRPGRILLRDFADGNPMPDRVFTVITSINWLFGYARDFGRIDEIIDAADASLQEGGIWCWDWHDPQEPNGVMFGEHLSAAGWRYFDVLKFVPKEYPIYVFTR